MIWKTDENHPRLPWGVAGADTSGIVRQWEVAAHTSPGAIPVTEQMRPWLSEPIRGLTDFSGSSAAIEQTRPSWLSEPTQGLQICAAITDLIHSGYTEPTIPVNSLDQIQLRYEPSIPVDSFGRIQRAREAIRQAFSERPMLTAPQIIEHDDEENVASHTREG